MLGIKIDHGLIFNENAASLCKRAVQKVNILSRIAFSMTFDQIALILKSYITLYFSYYPMFCRLHSRKLNERKNNMKKVYKTNKSLFQNSLAKDNYLTIYHAHKFTETSNFRLLQSKMVWNLKL